MSDKKVLIEVKDLCKSFGNVNVLNGISSLTILKSFRGADFRCDYF